MLIQTTKSEPWLFKFIADQYKTQPICKIAAGEVPWKLEFVPDLYNTQKTQEVCEEALECVPWMFQYVPDECKTQNMCKRYRPYCSV